MNVRRKVCGVVLVFIDEHGHAIAHAGGERLARSVAHGQILRRGASQAPAEHGDARVRARVCFEPDPAAIVRLDGLPRPVVAVRAFGNAIVPQVAAEFIGAYLDAEAMTA
jgi:hypothetical protein